MYIIPTSNNTHMLIHFCRPTNQTDFNSANNKLNKTKHNLEPQG